MKLIDFSDKKLKDFFTEVETYESLYKLDFLGYPWYLMAQTNIRNRRIYQKAAIHYTEQRIRKEDFKIKQKLLKETFDYVFFISADSRKDSIESAHFQDLFKYLKEKEKRFIIFEGASGGEGDKKYLESKYADITVPQEFVQDRTFPEFVTTLRDSFTQEIANLFEESLPDNFQELREEYIRLRSKIHILIFNQTLMRQLKGKAFFGAKGTHAWTGFNNEFSVVEVDHGYQRQSQNKYPQLSEKVKRYYETVFNLDKYFFLCNNKTSTSLQKGLYREENVFNNGLPELRNYEQKEIKKTQNPIILIATTGGNYNETDLRNLIALMRKKFKADIWIKTHPTYEKEDRYSDIPYIKSINNKPKYDSFSEADVIICAAGSMAYEAANFTQKYMIFPIEEANTEKLFPRDKILHLNDYQKFLNKVEAYLKMPKIQFKRKEQGDYISEYDKLFKRIENA